MKIIQCFCIVIALLIPTLLYAENNLPVLNNTDVTKMFIREDIKKSLKDINRFDLSRIRIIRNLGFKDGAMCVAPPPVVSTDIDIHRSLLVHDQATLNAGDFSLRRTLQKLASDVSGAVPATTPESIFQQMWDTQNDEANQETAGNRHCSDNEGKINGFPHNKCPRPEGIEATGTNTIIANRIDNDYKALAMVNRLDLAHQGWKNCGEHRIIYGKNTGGKNLIIFEAVLPNPKPGCRSGCRDVIEFWLDLSSDSIPASRATKLENFFFNGLPGFRPVVHTSHYSATGVSSAYGGSGSGQIRTNQFLFRSDMGQGPWTLKEFKTFLSCVGGTCDYDIMPISVKGNPYGSLWSRDVATGATVPALPPANPSATPITGLSSLATDFQSDVIAQVTMDKLGNPDINSFSYAVDPNKNSAESQSQSPIIDHYPNQFNAASDATFSNSLAAAASGFGLSANQVVNRATALSCAGCHLPGAFGLTNPNSIGPGMSWPPALFFVHVDTQPKDFLHRGIDPLHFGGNTHGFDISPALESTFLPARTNNLTNIANADLCDCVRKSTLFPLSTKKLFEIKDILRKSEIKINKQLEVSNKKFLKKKTFKPDDARKLFIKQKNIIHKAADARDAELKQSGVKLTGPSLKPQVVRLDGKNLSDKELKKLKSRRIKEIISKEPPRKTTTGSFRTH